MSKRVRIVTDLGCDLPKEIIEEKGIERLGMGVEIGGQMYNGLDLDYHEFYKKMREGEVARTSQVLYKDMVEVIDKIKKQGEIPYYIVFSSKLSGTFQTANLVKEDLNDPELFLIDSKGASVGQGLIVLEAAEMAEKGATPEEITERLNFIIPRMEHIFAVDDLVYLKRGGRISSMQAIVGGMLKIKPILHFVDGEIHQFDKVRSKKQVISRMLEIMEERGVDISSQRIGLNHADNLELAEDIKAAIAEKYGVKDFVLAEISPVIGAHSGPGTVSVFFLSEKQGGEKE
jgi:DegV family protein with EDD domain